MAILYTCLSALNAEIRRTILRKTVSRLAHLSVISRTECSWGVREFLPVIAPTGVLSVCQTQISLATQNQTATKPKVAGLVLFE